ncbi:septum formation protein Maf [Candidatus Nomurabacteria bacterium RIFCSPLOWO2_01_FULL_33_17]|uniref:dTTP/UTP pyrophosphatase n=1 Tax=Candidatus Nomurabacteria bacterium RIFCSPLOWO2_01_FULL_33_17 TaxID=1801764 RepID=A0A1F6WMJ1_9BACT|nr:MAG: septum formation protein Maf [Candidatus Nomurabacteria bacterium RIFCSPLOWO2_01_FULL_33_17]
MKKVILASTSPRRKELFEKTGIPFEIVASSYEEDMTLDMSPKDLAMFLSKGKAESVANDNPDAIVIGADTFIAFEDKVLGKPHTKERAKEMLSILSGKQHFIITGFTIIEKSSGKLISKAVESKILLKNLTEKEIEDYIATGEPLDKAGAYAVQGLGANLIEKIEGDYSNILGLPVDEVLEALKEFEVN